MSVPDPTHLQKQNLHLSPEAQIYRFILNTLHLQPWKVPVDPSIKDWRKYLNSWHRCFATNPPCRADPGFSASLGHTEAALSSPSTYPRCPLEMQHPHGTAHGGCAGPQPGSLFWQMGTFPSSHQHGDLGQAKLWKCGVRQQLERKWERNMWKCQMHHFPEWNLLFQKHIMF